MVKFLFFLPFLLFAMDYDCILIGSSPFTLIESLYQYHLGKTVLILEQASECGGAWKSIEVFDIPNVDMGCHELKNAPEVKAFLKDYFGCTFTQIDKNGSEYFT